MNEKHPEKRRTGHFTIVTSHGATGPILRLAGEINGSSASQVLRHLKKCPGRNLILDFSGVTEIGEFGARVLGTGLKEICRTGITINVDGLRPGLSQLLCLGGVFEAIVGRA
ncbi:MAG: STAS domain-containing protein [Candidatus Methylomirabilales bacterium]